MAKMLEALERARQERLKAAARELERTARRKAAAGDGNGQGHSQDLEDVNTSDHGAEADGADPEEAILGKLSELIVGAHDRQSPITEQFRQIRTNLETILVDYRARPIVVSSPLSGEGKSLFSANLAAVLADDPQHRVLLVDADMRKGSQHQFFGVRTSPGLSEVLRGRCALDEAIRPTPLPNLKLLPAGRAPDLPSVLLGSDCMLNLMGELQRRFRWIVFDSPPILPVTDALVLGRGCVGLLLVVRMDKSNRKAIERAQDVLAETRLPVLGCVVNDIDIKVHDYAYYDHYYGRGGGDEPEGFQS